MALFREAVKVGMAMAISTAMMATTISISIRVKPFSFFLSSLEIMSFSSFYIIYLCSRLFRVEGRRDTTSLGNAAVHGEHRQVDGQQQNDGDGQEHIVAGNVALQQLWNPGQAVVAAGDLQCLDDVVDGDYKEV